MPNLSLALKSHSQLPLEANLSKMTIKEIELSKDTHKYPDYQKYLDSKAHVEKRFKDSDLIQTMRGNGN